MSFTPPPTSQAPTWVSLTNEETEELDEPPEKQQQFARTTIRRPKPQPSLLTKAILSQPDEEYHETPRPVLMDGRRRRSMTSNVSIASTADLTSDTGLTSPCRTNTPSPPIPEMAAIRLNTEVSDSIHALVFDGTEAPAAPLPPKKRCIQFACAAKPLTQEVEELKSEPMAKAPSAEEAPRRPSIKFACPARPASTQNTPPKQMNGAPGQSGCLPVPHKPESPSTPKKASALSTALQASPRPQSIRRLSNKILSRPKYLRANSTDMVKDGSQFHEFASGTEREEDWIRQDSSAITKKITIHDTLTKENHFRRLGAEAEEEAEMEEEEEEDAPSDNDDEEEDEDEEDDVDVEDEEEQDEDFDDSDGYHTDEETGFAESDDDEDDDDENMMLWTSSAATAHQNSVIVPIRRPSVHDSLSDASTRGSIRRVKPRRIADQPDAPDLPDSTDFVCGTLDEDRPLEEAYLSSLAARRNGKLRVIPQDIDPSFPTSDPENDEDQNIYNPVHHDSDDDMWGQGKMEDLHHGQDRSRRRRKSEQASPRKYRSPPPPRRHYSPPPPQRRHHSPAPKARGRSPKPLFGRQSPRRIRSPATKAMITPTQTPRQGPAVQLYLAGRPGIPQTKSLPRTGALCAQMKHARAVKHAHEPEVHLRGAIDIFKGLERKRQRRKEKFFQKYCNRARRGQIPDRKPQPGRGAERMKELGLLMAGKKDPGNYVMSV